MDSTFKTITLRGVYSTRQLFINGRELRPEHSQRIVNHSPDGFNWSYGGSGPAQASLAILLELLDDENQALAVYQDFKWMLLANLMPANFSFDIDMQGLKTWVRNQMKKNNKGGAYKTRPKKTFAKVT